MSKIITHFSVHLFNDEIGELETKTIKCMLPEKSIVIGLKQFEGKSGEEVFSKYYAIDIEDK